MKRFVLVISVLIVSLSLFAAYKPSVTAKQAPEPVVQVISEETAVKVDFTEAKRIEKEFEGTGVLLPISSYEHSSQKDIAAFLQNNQIEYIAQIVLLPEDLTQRQDDRIVGLVTKPQLQVVPYAYREELREDEKKDIEDAFQEIVSAYDVRIAMPQLKEVAPETMELVVTDLFYIRMITQLEEYIEEHPEYIRMIFNLGIKDQEEQLFIAFRIKTEDGYEWKVLDKDTVYINKDLTVTVDYEEIGPVSIIRAVQK